MLAAVVVTFRPPPGVLAAAVRSVLDGGGVERVIVVDNGGQAPSALGELAQRVTLVTPSSNGGFGAGANAGIRAAIDGGATAVAVLNDDVRVEPGWAEPLLDELASDLSLGAVQPKLLVDGSDPVVVNSVGVTLDRACAGHDIGYGEPDGPPFDEPRDIAIFTGGAVVLRDEFIVDVGPFDERWFLYYEDVDLALRGARQGWRYRCVPASVVWHAGSATTAGLGDRTRYLQERNRLRLAARHGTLSQMARAAWLSIRRLRHAPHRVHARALAAGVAGWPREWWGRLRR